MRLAVLAVLALCALPLTAAADGAVPVTLPTLPTIADPSGILSDLVWANVIASNCADHAITMGEWGLLTGTADMIAESMGLTTEAYDRDYYGPAFDALDDPNACAIYGPTVRPMLELVESWGGRPFAK